MSACRNYFTECKGNILPLARDDIKWRGTHLVLTLAGYKWEVGWGVMSWGLAGWGEEHAHGICDTSPLLRCTGPQKVRNGNCERGCKDYLARRSQVVVVEGGSPHISAQGCIIISKVNI